MKPVESQGFPAIFYLDSYVSRKQISIKGQTKMKILLIGEVGSIHVARWANQLRDTGWDYRIFQPVPSTYGVRGEFSPSFFYLPYETNVPKGSEVEYTLENKHLIKAPSLFARAKRKGFRILYQRIGRLRKPISMIARVIRKFLIILSSPFDLLKRVFYKSDQKSSSSALRALDLSPEGIERIVYILNRKASNIEPDPKSTHAAYLAELLKEWQPDVIHSLGLFVNWQNNALTLLEARRILGNKLPCPWIVSTWGADLDLYPFLGEKERQEAETILKSCDGLVIEGNRDVALARNLGFTGKVLAKIPVFGGVTWKAEDYGMPGPASDRRVILLKGRDNTDSVKSGGDPQGRAMTAMFAFQRCQDLLKSYSIVIVQATPAIEVQAKILEATTGLKVTVFPNTTSLPHKQLLNLLGTARIMMAITASDGLPSTLIEAMSLGAFPIHSNLETVSEWVEDGKNGFLVPPEDVNAVAQALRIALTDDAMVDKAAELNAEIVSKQLADPVIRQQVIALYKAFA
jgi:glycosyltransferase involved in cell wall biosynthesis